ncbi:MAG: SRPBCC family protein [Chloroflexi bacterium]|nr:SRPBCC family protein [Chloroflexota bacterium]
MPRAEQSIIISGDLDHIFAVTNDIARWPDLFVGSEHPRLLTSQRSGRFARLEYELCNAQGQAWRSWRFLDYEKHVAIAQRETPMFPYRYMYLTWRYEPAEDGVRMTSIQDFEMDPNAPVTNDQALARALEHMATNLTHFKQVLEMERE